MLYVISKAIVTQYNTLTYGGSPISDTAKLYDGQSSDTKAYPFSQYNLLDTTFDFDFCNNIPSELFQITIFDNQPSSARVMNVADTIYEGFQNATLTVDGYTFIAIYPVSLNRIQVPDDDGWQVTIGFSMEIQKART